MKYVALGTLSAGAIASSTRVARARKKLAELGIEIESIYYTQGEYDFVDVFDVPNAEAMLAFSVWYAKQGFGALHSMPAFDSATMNKAIKGGGKKRAARKASRKRK